ncbi:MAG: conjugative transfer signal peptidase TraF [bacterium]|nr:conjugative transfer signal peptidase TraF [bacterium]
MRKRIVVGILAVSALLVGVGLALDVRVNWTTSMPLGFYRRIAPVLERDAWVAICLEGEAARIAEERGYVIRGRCESGLAPIFKRIAAVPGDRVAMSKAGVRINGEVIAKSATKEVDSRGRPLAHAEEGEVVIESGRYFVLGMNTARSWDSRYFGAVSEHQIIAGARPLWTLQE